MNAVQAAGLGVARVEVSRDGVIVVVPGEPGAARNIPELKAWDGVTAAPDDLDQELADFNARHDQD
jgi:hypothetical protein